LKIVWILIGVCFLNNLQSQIIWATKPLINASEVFPFEEEMAHFSLNGKFGYIDRFGNVSIPPTYLSARPFHNGLAIVSELKGFGAIDKRGETILNLVFPSLSDFEKNSVPLFEHGNYYCTKSGNRISAFPNYIIYFYIGPQAFFYLFDPERNNSNIAQQITGNNGLVAPFYRNYSKAYFEENIQLIDTNYNDVFNELFDQAFYITENIACVLKRDNWAYYKIGIGPITPLEYDMAYPFKEGYGNAMLGDNWTFIDTTGREVRSEWYEEAHPFSEGMAAVKVDDRYGFVNRRIELTIPYTYERITDLTPLTHYDGLDSVSILGQKRLSEYKLFNEQAFHNGLAKVKNNGKYGFIDQFGEEIVPVIYDEVYLFSEGLAAVKFRDKWGFIDDAGKMIIEPTFEQVTYFREGLAAVKYGAFWGVIKNPLKKEKTYQDYQLRKPQATAAFAKSIILDEKEQVEIIREDSLFLPAGVRSINLEILLKSNFYLNEDYLNYHDKFKLSVGEKLFIENETKDEYQYRANHKFSLKTGVNKLVTDVVYNSIIVGSTKELIVVVEKEDPKKKKPKN